MRKDYYLIDDKLTARSLRSYLSKRGTWREVIPLPRDRDEGEVVGHAEGPALPVTPDGNLHAGVLYESSKDPQVRFYLPAYRLNEADGLYTTRLKWRDEADDPNGPLAFLTVDVVAVVPAETSFTMQEIPHETIARLMYQMEVRSESTTTDLRPLLSIEVGALNPIGNGVRRAVLPISEKSVFDRLYQILTDASFLAHLEIHCFADAGRYTWHQIVQGGFQAEIQTEILKNKKILYTDLIGQPKEEMSSPVVNTRKILLEKSLGQKISWQNALQIAENADAQVFEATIQSQDSQDIVSRIIKDRATTIQYLRTGMLSHLSPVITGGGLRIQSSRDPDLRAAGLPPLSSPGVADLRRLPAGGGGLGPIPRPGRPEQPQTRPTRAPVMRRTLQEEVVQPILRRAYAPTVAQALSASDILIDADARPSKAVPARVCLDEDGKPALVKISVEARQLIDPFYFLPATNAYMFDIPDAMQPGDRHVLIPLEVFNGDVQVGVIYQDSANANQVYYKPEEFRLPRLDSDPYKPDLRISFYELVTQDEEDNQSEAKTATINYKVQLAYRAVPHLNPLLLTLAREKLFTENPSLTKIHFNALAPQTTLLSLRVPEDETEGLLSTIPRPDVEVRFDYGIVDIVELSSTEFERIFTSFQSPAGVGIEGVIEAKLSDKTTTQVTLRLSVKETTGAVFHGTYMGTEGDGRHRVHMVNRIESPVILEETYTVPLGPNIFARPLDVPGRIVQPGEEFDLFYKIEPPTAAVFDLEPSLSVSIQVDPARLWPGLFINKGYRSQTFRVPLTTKAEFFSADATTEIEALTGLEVEFDDGTKTTLIADRLETHVDLRLPLLPYLLGESEAKKYLYRVTNLLGADAHVGVVSDWMGGEGESSLLISPVGA